jgi:threonine aldolase
MARVADFRSDTVTKPSPAMRRAMLEAEVGDDVLDGDPTVGVLEQRVAELLGKECALFVPSGTMANSVAIGSWTRPGDEIICERSAHIVCWEAGSPSGNHGVQALTLHAPDGRLDPDEVRSVVRMKSVHCPRTALVCVEQTFMGSGEDRGGCVIPLAHLRELRRVTRELEIPMHMDGARIANAAVASGVPMRDYADCADTVSLCLSKGLGAPVGSLVAGPRELLLGRGKILRKRLGGWMRQCGILAAAGLYALEHNVERLSADHALARELATVLSSFTGITCAPATVDTNIVMAKLKHPKHDPVSLMNELKKRGVLVLPQNATTLRFVTHLDVGREDVEQLRGALKAIFAA